MDRSSVTIDGIRLGFFREGRGRDVLFVHGLATWSAVWEPLARTMSGSFSSTALDLPGLGRSDLLPHGFGLADLSTIVSQFITAVRLENPIIAAHSFGCLPVLADLPSFAGHELLLVSPYLGDRGSLPWLKPLSSPERGRFFRTEVGVRGIKKIFVDLFHPARLPAEHQVKRLFEPLEDEMRRDALLRFHEMAGRAPSWRKMIAGKTSRTVRIVCGRGDPLYDEEEIGEFADATGAVVEVFENCGHFPQLEEPRLLACVIRRLAETPGS